MTEDLVRKTGRGVGWNMLAQMAQQAIRFVVIIVLTKLLDPADFGIFAMVLIFTEFIRPFREWGFQAALIQKKDIDEEYLSTAFWAIGGVAVVMYVLSFWAASWVARFFNLPLLGAIIPVIALIFLASPFGAIQWALVARQLNFRLIAVVDTLTTLCYGIAACSLALRGHGVWSLVLATLISEVCRSVLFWVSYRWHPLLRFSLAKFRDLLGFAANCTGSGVLNFGINYFDGLLVGKFLGVEPLGFYNLAVNTVSQPETRIVSQITSVIFPVFSMIKDDKERIQEAYLKTIKTVAIIVMPLIAVLFVVTKDFVLFFYGAKWLPAVTPIKIMCLFGIVKAMASIASPIFMSQGRPDIDLKLTLLRLPVFVGIIFFGIKNGIVGVAAAVLVYSLVNFFPTFTLANRLLGVRAMRFYAPILRYIAVSVVVMAALGLVGLVYQQHGLTNPLARLVLSVLAGSLVYAAILRFVLKTDFDYIVDLVKRIVL